MTWHYYDLGSSNLDIERSNQIPGKKVSLQSLRSKYAPATRPIYDPNAHEEPEISRSLQILLDIQYHPFLSTRWFGPGYLKNFVSKTRHDPIRVDARKSPVCLSTTFHLPSSHISCVRSSNFTFMFIFSFRTAIRKCRSRSATHGRTTHDGRR